jgi:hypothetical protein
VFKIGRTTNLIVDTVDGGWARGLSRSGTWREAMAKGFTQAEVDEQVANLRTGIENAAAAKHAQQWRPGQPGAVAAARRHGADHARAARRGSTPSLPRSRPPT